MKKLLIIILALVMCVSFAACGSEEEVSEEVSGNVVSLPQYDTENPVVQMTIKDYGTIIIELYPDIAPNTVNNFISLVKKGYYDNNTILRCQSDFVIQGGDPTGTGSGGPDYSIKGEFSSNGFENKLAHTEGVISMARTSDPDSAGSQFFIMLSATYQSALDGSYAAFGKVIEGMDVCHAIEKAVGSSVNMGFLSTPITIEKTVVDLKGEDYPEPEIIK